MPYLLRVAVDERALKLLPGMEEAAHDGPFGYAHDLCHLLIAQPLDFSHHDDAAMVRRQRVESGLQARPDLLSTHDLERIGSVEPAKQGKVGLRVRIRIERALRPL